MMYNKTEKWQFRYEVEGTVRTCYPNSKEKVSASKNTCAKNGWKVLSVDKMYPFNYEKNAHNFELINNVCSNRLHDFRMGDLKLTDTQVAYLKKLQEKAQDMLQMWPGNDGIAWLTWNNWKTAKELTEMAVSHRAEVCIATGHSEYVQYC